LSRHLQILQEAGLIAIAKSFADNRPQTHCRITPSGRQRYLDYLSVLEKIVRDAAGAAKTVAADFGWDAPGLAPT
jgi:DNA-binding MarR family transcriptional regulator